MSDAVSAEILCVGTELLLGDTVNTNASYIAKEVSKFGINVYRQTVVGDNKDRLLSNLDRAFKENDIVITTGGLGPTYDDITKETVAEYFKLPMYFDEVYFEEIKNYFQKLGLTMTENNKKQAMVPQNAKVIKNECGTAPGIIIEDKGSGKTAILLPGPPREMQCMFDKYIVKFFEKRSKNVLVSHNIHLFNIGEAFVESKLNDIMKQSKNPTIAPYAKNGEVLLRVTAYDKDKNNAEKLIAPILKKVCDTFNDHIYGIDVVNLQTALVTELSKKRLKVATAESCTGGLVSKRITEVSGSSNVFECGVCSYSNRIKNKILGVNNYAIEKFSAVSKETVKEMALGIKNLSGADIGISTTGLAGPGGGTKDNPVGLVYVGVASDWYSEVLELKLSKGQPDEREIIRYIASSHALNLALRAAKYFKQK